jgi:hypothetical protein
MPPHSPESGSPSLPSAPISAEMSSRIAPKARRGTLVRSGTTTGANEIVGWVPHFSRPLREVGILTLRLFRHSCRPPLTLRRAAAQPHSHLGNPPSQFPNKLSAAAASRFKINVRTHIRISPKGRSQGSALSIVPKIQSLKFRPRN